MKGQSAKQVVKVLKSGGVIAFPTETVFGIGALLYQPAAIERIFKIKNRPQNKPLQILVANYRQAKELGMFNKEALCLAKKEWPGPLTLIVHKTKKVPKIVNAGGKTVGIRIPAHSRLLALLRQVGPIAATSANITGAPPFLTTKEVKNGLTGVDYVLPGRVKLGKASHVIDATDNFKVLRT